MPQKLLIKIPTDGKNLNFHGNFDMKFAGENANFHGNMVNGQFHGNLALTDVSDGQLRLSKPESFAAIGVKRDSDGNLYLILEH